MEVETGETPTKRGPDSLAYATGTNKEIYLKPGGMRGQSPTVVL